MAGVGAGVALSKYLIPIGAAAIKSRSVNPITDSFGNTNVLMAMGKDAIAGYAIGYAGGKVLDITGLKKPVNAVLKKVKM